VQSERDLQLRLRRPRLLPGAGVSLRAIWSRYANMTKRMPRRMSQVNRTVARRLRDQFHFISSLLRLYRARNATRLFRPALHGLRSADRRERACKCHTAPVHGACGHRRRGAAPRCAIQADT